MVWQPKRGRIDWRAFLKPEEAKVISESDRALAKLEKARDAYNRNLGARRSKIVNRAIQRAKFQEAQ